jgi:catechol 2,3-dioxygenase-like lactoylglutathione lyase family enzyme/carbon monoxide dehydrogenase subunit G
MTTSAEHYRPPINQIAFSVIDLQITEKWFREGLGFLPAGGSQLLMSGPLAAIVQGVPGAASTCWWLIGRNPYFQLELFQFRRPMAKLMPGDARPCDIGYRRIGVWVADFDATLKRLERFGSYPLADIQGQRGQRRACVRNPDGVFVEILEEDPLPAAQRGEETQNCSAAVRSVTLSTPDVQASVDYFKAISGQKPVPSGLHTAEHEALWGLAGASTKSASFTCGSVMVEVVQYLTPLGKPWPQGYRICDQGILNIAFGARSKPHFNQVHQRAMAFGARHNARPIHVPGAGVVYVNDALGFSVEILWMGFQFTERMFGFVEKPVGDRPRADTHSTQQSVYIAAPLNAVWATLNDHNTMGDWIGFGNVKRIRDGMPLPNGRCAERLMKGAPGTVVEQVTGVEPQSTIRYRVVEGSPFVYHQGQIVVTPNGAGTQIDWTIRFRSKIPLLGGLFKLLLPGLLKNMLHKGLKPVAEKRFT